jgi:hypothetical protein
VRKNNPAVKSFLNCVLNWKRYRFHKSNP